VPTYGSDGPVAHSVAVVLWHTICRGPVTRNPGARVNMYNIPMYGTSIRIMELEQLELSSRRLFQPAVFILCLSEVV
jgi:hypothetical protein